MSLNIRTAKFRFASLLLILSFGCSGASSKTKLEAQVGDQVTVSVTDATIPLPATILAINKNKYTVQMLPSFQFKGSEQFQVSARQIKLVFPAGTANSKTNDLSSKTEAKTSNPKVLKATATAGTKAKSLSGLYTRFGQSFAGKKMICQEELFYFYPDGRVYHALPPEGPAHLDWAEATRKTPNLCGTYGIIGDTIVFQWSGDEIDKPVTWKLRHKGNNLELNGMVADKAPSFPANAKLLGTYARQEIIVNQGKPTTSPVKYTFTLDGKVTLEQRDKQSVKKQTGTYLLSGNDIEICFGADNTTKTSTTIFPQHLDNRSAKSPDRLSINGKLFEKIQ